MSNFYRILLLALCFFSFSCATTFYDHYTFTETIEAKVQTEGLIKDSVNPYHDYIAQVASLKNRLNKMVLYERSKSKNPISIKMWEFLNAEGSSIHKFLRLWEERGKLSPAFTEEYSKQTNEIFQLMLDYETKKDEKSEDALSSILGVF